MLPCIFKVRIRRFKKPAEEKKREGGGRGENEDDNLLLYMYVSGGSRAILNCKPLSFHNLSLCLGAHALHSIITHYPSIDSLFHVVIVL